MAIRTILDSRGLVQTRIPGTQNEFVVQAEVKEEVQVGTLNTSFTVGDFKNVVLQNSTVITASLPGIADSMVGTGYNLMAVGTANVLVSASNGINGLVMVHSMSSNPGTLSVMAVSSSVTGYRWHIVSSRTS